MWVSPGPPGGTAHSDPSRLPVLSFSPAQRAVAFPPCALTRGRDGKFRSTVTPLLSWRQLLPATRTCPARSLGLFLGQLFKVESLSVSSQSPLFSTLRRSVLLSVVSSVFMCSVSSHSCPRSRAVSLSKSTDFLSGPSVGEHFCCFSLLPPSWNEPRARSLLLLVCPLQHLLRNRCWTRCGRV